MSSTTIPSRFAEVLGGRVMPYELDAEMREHLPLFWSDATGGWVAAKHDDVKRVLEDEELFGPLGYGPGSSAIHGRVILHMEGREHRKKSALIGQRIRNPRRLNDDFRGLANSLSARYLDALPFDEPIDLKAGFTTPLPLQITADLMGIPEAPQFREWYDTIVAAGASNLSGDPDVLRRGQEARVRLVEFLTPVVEDRRRNPRDDMLSDLCTFEYEGEPITTDEILGFCSFLLAAGVETTDRALSNLLRLLIDDRELWDALRNDRSLIPSATAEILRYAPPVHGVSRGCRVDTELSGGTVAAGDRILVLLASANRDEDHFEDAGVFRMDRFVDNASKQFTPKSDILPFGAGRHHCTGSLLAQMEMEVAMQHLLDRVAWAEWVDGQPEELGYVLRAPQHLNVRLHAA
ncbi:MAG TPA: cytochrome P450 [Acidimicrobiia bacterium]|nr:cytochrome P450 [Acidimicrobiia bacterium]